MEVLTNEIRSNVEKLELYSELYPFNLPLRITTFQTEKEFLAFIKNCEKLVRGSLEYRQWRKYITDVLQVTNCAITNESSTEICVELHHHIPSLFMVVKALVSKKMEEEQSFSTFDIATETIELHFANKIGYTPLITSLHEKFHAGFLKIPIEHVRGDWKYFIENYIQYLDEDDKNIITDRLAIKLNDFPTYNWSRDSYPGVQSA